MSPPRASAPSSSDGIVLMVGTALHTKGGVAAVVNAWQQAGLFERWRVHYVGSNGGITPVGAVAAALKCYATCVGWMCTGRVGLVHVHHSSYVSFWRKAPVFALAMLFRRPLIVSLHGGGFMDFYRSLASPAKWWQRWIMRYACRYLVLTERWRQWALALQPSARVAVLPNLVSHIPQDIPPYPSDDSEPIILFLGRIEPLKGVSDLIQALAQAQVRGAPWQLVLGGIGDLDQVQLDVQRYGLTAGTVECIGWVDQERKDSLLRQCSALVLPSHFENMPVTILEAFAYARPVIATTVGGIPDMVSHGGEGFLVAPGSVTELANALVVLWNLGRRQRQRMGQAGRDKMELVYSRAAILQQIEEVYTACSATNCSRRI